jgi:hypothetical protein
VIEETLAGACLVLAAIPALLFIVNLFCYRPAPSHQAEVGPVSVLIPARNEERSIEAAVTAALQSQGVSVEVIVLDDHSEDRTADLVARIARRDGRVRLIAAPALPPGWCGKQYACFVLAGLARHPLLCFLDADVRLAPDGLARLAGFLEQSGADLVSGLPRQQTGTWLERLVIPLIHFILLGFLPLPWMRRSRHAAFAAGCGQLFLARREAYEQVGGHEMIASSRHDGIQLPRAFRLGGKKTDLCDATDLATCRMYRGAGEVWGGLAKNATEGLAAPALIGPATLLLGGGQVLPLLLLAYVRLPAAFALAALAAVLAWLPRLLGALWFRQSLLGAALHPAGVAVLVAIQWWALVGRLVGKPATWKGRSYPTKSRIASDSLG